MGNEVQQNAIKQVVSKVTWMLTDEVSSSLLKMYPITSSILDIVANHIKNSENTATCMLEEVPLQFVFGEELSIEKFIPEFRRLTLPNYHLNHEAGFHYLVKDYLPEKKDSVKQSSLVPPLTASTEWSAIALPFDKSVEAHAVTETKLRPLSVSSHKHLPAKQETVFHKKIREDSVGSSSGKESGKESDTESDVNVAKTKKLRKTVPRDVPLFFTFGKDINDSDFDDEPIGHSSPKKIVGSNESTKGLITPIPKLSEGMNPLPPKDQSKFGIVQQGTMSSFKRVHKSIPKLQRDAQLASSCESSSPDWERQPPAFHLRKKYKLKHHGPSDSESNPNSNTNEDGM